jgi:hypothetical protein
MEAPGTFQNYNIRKKEAPGIMKTPDKIIKYSKNNQLTRIEMQQMKIPASTFHVPAPDKIIKSNIVLQWALPEQLTFIFTYFYFRIHAKNKLIQDFHRCQQNSGLIFQKNSFDVLLYTVYYSFAFL